MKKKLAGILVFAIVFSSAGNIFGAEIDYGDVDCSGSIEAADALLVLQKTRNKDYTLPVEEAYPDTYESFIDVDGNGKITATDAAYIMKKVNDESFVLPAEETTEESSSEETTEETTYESEIVLADNSITVNGLSESNGGVEIYNDDNYIIITNGGSYDVSGSLNDGQIIVDSESDVEINLQGVSIANNAGPAIYGLNGDIEISAKNGYENSLSDGESSELDDDGEPDACIYSSDGLKLKGKGSLSITGNYANGISGKDEVEIQNLTLTVNSADNAIKAKDSLTVASGTLSLTSQEGDGMRCTKGDIIINGGEIEANIQNNGIYAKAGSITINGGTIKVNAASDSPDEDTYDYDGIKAKASVYINDGELTLNALGEGIQSTVNTEITGGEITVDAEDTGIEADADINISGGTVNVSAVDKGINSTSGNISISDSADITVTVIPSSSADTDTYNYDGIHAKTGIITISGGSLNVKSYCDGIQAAGDLAVSGSPEINIETTGVISTSSSSSSGFGGYAGNQTADISAKGIKSDTDITIESGSIAVDSTDDSIHANGSITITDGTYTLITEDDGIHADDTLTIDGGTITVEESYEGIEGANIYINGGTIYIYADDDSINAAGGNDGSSSAGFSSETTGYLEINGGYIYCENTDDGDGVDSNGNIIFNGGTLLVNGPTSGSNAAIDYGDSGYMAFNGGSIVAVGSSEMATYPTASSSSKNTLIYGVSSSSGMTGNKPGGSVNTSSTISAGTLITVSDSSGNVVMAFKPVNKAACVVLSSEDIATGSTYQINTGGTYSETLDSCGYAEGGTISGATKLASGKVSSTLTTLS